MRKANATSDGCARPCAAMAENVPTAVVLSVPIFLVGALNVLGDAWGFK